MRGIGKSVCTAGALSLVALMTSVPAFGTITFQLGGGWEADVPDDSNVSIVVDTDNTDPSFIAIEISKDFLDPPEFGVFPAQLIAFRQVDTDANTVSRIVIADEAITNQTGVDWTDYHYSVANNGGVAWFNVPLSDFQITPFTNKVFTDLYGFGDPDKATDIDLDGGVVPNNSTFYPGGPPNNGDIVIDVDLSINNSDNESFVLKQFPTPEPSSIALLVCGGALVAVRRRK